MFLSYFDDSGSEPSSDVCVFGGVVIPGDFWGHAEAWSHVITEHLGIDELTEFKAVELYGAKGQFEKAGIVKCREAFLLLLNLLVVNNYKFIYSAVNRKTLQEVDLFESAHPVDIAFQMCLGTLEEWAREQNKKPYETPLTKEQAIIIRYESMCLVIADECEGNLRRQMLQTFRKKRKRTRIKGGDDPRRWLFHVHDSMYFGSSKDSVGLQIADAANWTMNRYLRGDKLDDQIREQLLKVALCAKAEPYWTKYRSLFIDHSDASVLNADERAKSSPSVPPEQV